MEDKTQDSQGLLYHVTSPTGTRHRAGKEGGLASAGASGWLSRWGRSSSSAPLPLAIHVNFVKSLHCPGS